MAITGNHGACLSVSVTKTANTCAHFIWFILRNKWKNVCGPQIIDGASQNFEMLLTSGVPFGDRTSGSAVNHRVL